MTRYNEAGANRLEAQANRSNDPAEQSRLWAKASEIGTPVEYCTNGGLCDLSEGCDCD